MNFFKSHQFLPLNRSQVARAPSEFHPWLQDQSSLTQKLIRYSEGVFEVRVLNEQIGRMSLEESHILQVGSGNFALIREVYLCCSGVPCVYAKSIIPVTIMKGEQRRLMTLGNLPLGQFLFSSSNLKRQQVDILPLASNANVWGRRTRFDVRFGSLLVSEYFLPPLLTNTQRD